ncbi:FMN-binding negative transcriptional regulator [Acidovorax sp. A79]|uniref:FMN-binding negative transcriptional regulator n=1 Tax=Acidovorax sp. A79 TaxID=3056107 RepID=UPI0034E83EA2
MYSQSLFSIDDVRELQGLVRSYPLATVVAAAHAGLEAHLLPLLPLAEGGGLGLLQGHVARMHTLARSVPQGAEVLAVFQSPNAYISPRWYVNGQRSARLAPSWNYVAVEARGRIRFVDDGGWMRDHLAALTASQEAHRAQPWSLHDASPAFIDEAALHLRGFEIEVTRLEGKRFLSQQRTPADRSSLVAHLALERQGAAHDVAALIVP